MKNSRDKANKRDRSDITPLLLDAAAVAAVLSVSRRTIYSLMSTSTLGPLPIRFGKRTLWRYEELAAWVRAGCPRRDVWLKMAQEQGFGYQGGQRF
jgi:predicted DNA-binding transcriptional regulator AlpA